jgi:hypothetical protein
MAPPPAYILCRQGFSDAFVAKILAATPDGWRVVQTWEPMSSCDLQPNTFFIVSGSPTQQKTQTLKIRFGGGSSLGAFNLPLGKFPSFLDSLVQQK